jgi:lambda repressor-like predicted transcriptional regulator
MRNPPARVDSNQPEIVAALRAAGASVQERTSKNCSFCGKEFRTKPSHYDKKFYCSRACMAEHYKTRMRGENNPNYSSAGTKICEACGSKYHSYDLNRKYCSADCYNHSEIRKLIAKQNGDKQRKPPGNCAKCGKEIHFTRKYCSECKQQPKKPSVCLHCGKESGTTRDVRYCKVCRSAGVHKKKPVSICQSCGTTVHVINRKYCDDCFRLFSSNHRDHPRRVDSNQSEIVAALQNAGCSVVDLSAVGGGCPDIMAGYKNRNIMIEIKYGRNKLNKLQKLWFSAWQGEAYVVYSAEQAIEIITGGNRD